MVENQTQNAQQPASAAELPAAIDLKGVSKSFGPVQANKNINLTVKRNSIHGIVGENGAGKSTLMSILYGFYTADAGEIFVNGQKVSIKDSSHALELGIGMVHQHFMLVENFTVLENIILGAEGDHLLASSKAAAREELARLAKDYGLEVDPDAVIEDLSVGQEQRVEILKALYRGADVLILDEPTGVLTPTEARPIVPHSRATARRGQNDHFDHAQAARNHGHYGHGFRDASWHDGGHRRDRGHVSR